MVAFLFIVIHLVIFFISFQLDTSVIYVPILKAILFVQQLF